MPFAISPYPGQTYPPRYATHHDIRAMVGHGKLVQRSFGGRDPYTTVESSKLPVDFSYLTGVRLTDGRFTMLEVRPGHVSSIGRRGKSSKHRCHVRCPDCQAWVPAGRTLQHKCRFGTESGE